MEVDLAFQAKHMNVVLHSFLQAHVASISGLLGLVVAWPPQLSDLLNP